jgi:hypothetical protein
MVELSGTLLVVYQICAAEHDIFLFSRGAHLTKMGYLDLS